MRIKDRGPYTMGYIDKLRVSMGANDIFVSWCDLEELKAYSDEKAANGQWNPIVYIMDSYYEPAKKFDMGHQGTIYPQYRKEIENSVFTVLVSGL